MDLSQDERDERVRQLKEVIGDEMDEETCAALLEESHWSVESTARKFFEGPSSPRLHAQPGDHVSPNFFNHMNEPHVDVEDDDDELHNQLNETAPFLDEAGGMRSRRGGRGLSPERDNTSSAAQYGAAPRNRSLGVPPLPQKSVSALIKEAFTGIAPTETPASAARRFAAEFEKLVGSDRQAPEFFESSFEDALLSASTERKTLVAYIHSPLHPDSEAFCRDILCSRPVLNALQDQRVWGGSVVQADGYLTSGKLQVAGFPCLVLIATDRGRDARIIDRVYVDDMSEPNLVDRIAAKLQAVRNARPVAVAPSVSPAQQREMDERRRVVEEQDAALRQAMEEDRRREEEKRARERQAQEERQRKEDEERAKAEALQNKRLRIRAEPSAGSNTATIRFQFPGGTKMNRRFDESDTVGYVREFLDVHLADQLKTPHLNYALILSYPKRTLDDKEQTLKDAGLVPQAVLLLQDLDA